MDGVIIRLGDKTKTLRSGETYTFKCDGGFLSLTNDLSITFNSAGYFSYNGLVTVGRDEKTRTLKCAGKKMATDVVVTAGEYGSASLSSPPEVATETEMNALLTNATSESVGMVYRYIGKTTDTYESGALYIIAKENT